MGLATRDSESHEAGTSAEASGRIEVARTWVIFTTRPPVAVPLELESEDVLPIALDILLLGLGVLCRADPVGEVLLHQVHPGAHAGLIVVEATGAHARRAALLRVADLLDGGEAGP